MKTILFAHKFLVEFIIVILMVFNTGKIYARDYSIDRLRMSIEADSRGQLTVTETRTFRFEGSFSEVYRTFPLSDTVSFDNIAVFEGSYVYQYSDSGAEGTFSISERSNEKEVVVHFDATDTARVFSIRFTIDGAVRRYEDAALLYYQLISEGWSKAHHDISVEIIPPESLPENQPAHWVHGSLDAVSSIKQGGRVSIELGLLPAERFLEIRALYPPAVFNEMEITPGVIKSRVEREAGLLAEEANRKREEQLERQRIRDARHAAGKRVAIPAALIIISILPLLFRKYSDRPVYKKADIKTGKMPEKHPPAMVSYLLFSGYVTGNALVSTLFHLAYRGYIRIEEIPSKKPGLVKKPKYQFVIDREKFNKERESMPEYEAGMLDLFFGDISGGSDVLGFRQLKKKSSKVQSFFTRWRKEVKKEAEKQNWFDPKSKKGRNIGLATGSVLFAGSLISAVFLGPWMLIPVLAALILLIGSLFIYHRSPSGEKAYRQWMALKKYLKKHRFGKDTARLEASAINEYLIYGIALGLGKGYFKRFARWVEESGQTPHFWWIVLYSNNISGFGKALNEVINTTSGTMSSASGMGGGGTMGGGGGVSSGGGGAR